MPEVTATMVKDLREKTGAGMMDCKIALDETKGDMEAAIDWLRKKGLSAAAKKAGRVAAEGLVAIATSDKNAAIVEVNAETDFVGRNEQFQKFAVQAAQTALATNGDVEAVKAKLQERLTSLIATIGENMSIRRAAQLGVKQGIVASYMHNALAPNVGRIGVLVALESAADAGKLMELGKQLAMHVAAARPEFLSTENVDAKSLERERNIFTEQAKASGKPDNIIGKMVEGRIRKYYEDVVFLEQLYVVDGESRVKEVIEKAGKTLGSPVSLAGFVCYQLGEGIEKSQDDFAAEVAKMAS